MAIMLPQPIADFLNFMGIMWPNINEDQVREYGQHVSEFAKNMSDTHADAAKTVSDIGNAYQGASYEALATMWAVKSTKHMTELTDGCDAVSTAFGVGADVIIGMKTAALVQIGVMAAEFIAAQIAAPFTFGLSEAIFPALEEAGEQVIKFLEQQALDYVEGQILSAAVTPLVDKVADSVAGLAFGAAATAAGAGGAGESIKVDLDEVQRLATKMSDHADTIAEHGQTFAANTAGMTFE